MFELIFENPIRFLLAIAIGLATGWWIWAHMQRVTGAAEPAAAPAPAPEPAPEPETVEAPAPEPMAAAAPVAAAMAAPNIAAAVGEDDDLTKINGIGPKLCALCNSLGVRRFDQIAEWGEREVAEVDAHLGSFKGRITRDEWVEQAKLLAAGNLAEWEGRFGYKAK